MNDISALVPAAAIIPVLAFDSVAEALPVCDILVEAGLPLEITLRTAAAMDCISAVARELPQATLGAGTVMNGDQARMARDAGACFGVSPGLTPDLAEAVMGMTWPFLPGIATVSEAMIAAQRGFNCLKFFPAEASGGVAFLKSLAAVLPELKFCPTGGLNAANVSDYLALSNVFAAGGSWMIKRNADGSADLDAIREAAAACAALGQR